MPVSQADLAENLNKVHGAALIIEDQLDLATNSGERENESRKPADGIAVHGRNNGTLMQVYRKASPTGKHVESVNANSPGDGSDLKGQHTFGLIPAAVSEGEAVRQNGDDELNKGETSCYDDQSNNGGDT